MQVDWICEPWAVPSLKWAQGGSWGTAPSPDQHRDRALPGGGLRGRLWTLQLNQGAGNSKRVSLARADENTLVSVTQCTPSQMP